MGSPVRPAGLVAALSSGVWFDFFLTEPAGRFAIAKADDIEVTVLLVLIGVAVPEVALWGRRQQARVAAGPATWTACWRRAKSGGAARRSSRAGARRWGEGG